MSSRNDPTKTKDGEHSQLPIGMRSGHCTRFAYRKEASSSPCKSFLEKKKIADSKALRSACAGLVSVLAALVASLPGFAEPAYSAAQAVNLHTSHAPRNLLATAQGPARVSLSWQAPPISDSPVTGYGMQFSQDDGASWAVLPTLGRRSTSFVHTVGLAPSATVLYRVFAIGANGPGPAATVTVDLPRTSVPRITELALTINQDSHRWYPPRRTVDVTVRFDQAVTVKTMYGVPSIDLAIGRPPHRQSGYASDYLGGSGTDRLTFRYTAPDWHLDLSEIAVGTDALRLNGGRIANYPATHSALLVHGPATLDNIDHADTQTNAVLVIDTTAPAPAPPAPAAELRVARNDHGGSAAFAAMLTAAGALVSGTEIVKQVTLSEGSEATRRQNVATRSGESDANGDDSYAAVALGLGAAAAQRAAAVPGAPKLISVSSMGMTNISVYWGSASGSNVAVDPISRTVDGIL